MPSLTLKAIPEQLLDELRRSAARHRRSLNSEVLFRLERSLDGEAVDTAAVLTRVRELRSRRSLPPLTDELIAGARAHGRP
jgi:antitoxin FitA